MINNDFYHLALINSAKSANSPRGVLGVAFLLFTKKLLGYQIIQLLSPDRSPVPASAQNYSERIWQTRIAPVSAGAKFVAQRLCSFAGCVHGINEQRAHVVVFHR